MNRRTLLTRIVAAFSVVGIAGFSYPFLRSWIPGFRNEIIKDIDVEEMAEGEARLVKWLGRHIYVIRRTQTQVSALIEHSPSRLDPMSVSSRQPEFASNIQRSRKPEHLIVYANCTHLGCEVAIDENNGFSGFQCPCHRSGFDAAGRVEKGAAAKLNLEVPHYDYIGRNVIRLKEVRG
jgi:ubiquinol-cytochrome c reductase iron-sulfur subunit